MTNARARILIAAAAAMIAAAVDASVIEPMPDVISPVILAAVLDTRGAARTDTEAKGRRTPTNSGGARPKPGLDAAPAPDT